MPLRHKEHFIGQSDNNFSGNLCAGWGGSAFYDAKRSQTLPIEESGSPVTTQTSLNRAAVHILKKTDT